MDRIRWLEADWPVSMRDLGASLKLQRFSPETQDGFILRRLRADSIEGEYYERVDFVETIRDPYGGNIEVQRVQYHRVEFSFSDTYPQIELRMFTRRLKSFLTRTAEATRFGVTLSHIDVDVFGWARSLREEHAPALKVDQAQLSKVVLEEGITASVQLTSRGDIEHAYGRFTAGRKHCVEQLQVRFEHGGDAWAIRLSSDGAARCDRSISEATVRLLRGALIRNRDGRR